MRDDAMPNPAVRSQYRAFGGERPFRDGALHQHHTPSHITGGEDVWSRRAQGIIYTDVATLALDTRCREIQFLAIGLPAYREQHSIRCDRAYLLVLPIEKLKTFRASLNTLDAANLGGNRDTAPLKRLHDAV